MITVTPLSRFAKVSVGDEGYTTVALLYNPDISLIKEDIELSLPSGTHFYFFAAINADHQIVDDIKYSAQMLKFYLDFRVTIMKTINDSKLNPIYMLNSLYGSLHTEFVVPIEVYLGFDLLQKAVFAQNSKCLERWFEFL